MFRVLNSGSLTIFFNMRNHRRPLLLLGLLTLLTSSFAIPLCEGPNVSLWNNCYGHWTWNELRDYEGEFKNGNSNGQGTSTYSNGDKYSGEHKDGLRDGYGTLITKEGLKYVGQSKLNNFNGPGILYLADGSTWESGIYKDGDLITSQFIDPDSLPLRNPGPIVSLVVPAQIEQPPVLAITSQVESIFGITQFLDPESTPFTTHLWWACAYLAICSLLAFIGEYARREKMRRMVNSKYKSFARIGNYASEDSFKKQSLHASERGASDAIEILRTCITISKPYTESTGAWQMSRGKLDAIAYIAALTAHEQSLRQWLTGKVAFDQQEAQFSARDKSYSTKSYPIPPPSEPRKLSFVTYTSETGKCTSKLQHDERIISIPSIFKTKQFGSLEIDFNRYAESTFHIYKDLFQRIIRKEVMVRLDATAIPFARHNEENIKKILNDKILKALATEGEKYMREYDRSLSITSYETDLTLDSFDFPIVIIIKKISSRRYNFTICDAHEPGIVIYR